MGQPREWQNRIRRWLDELPKHCYMPQDELSFSMFETFERLTLDEAKAAALTPAPKGTGWGPKWGYGWFHASVTPNGAMNGKRLVLHIQTGGESLVYVNGEAAGAVDKQHHYIPLTDCHKEGDAYDIWAESYAGHGAIIENIGPVPKGREVYPKVPPMQATVGHSSVGMWEETAYQLLMDATVLADLYQALPPRSLRAQKVFKALCDMTLAVDFELSYEERVASFFKGRQALAPALACQNGSTAPEMYLLGQSHIDLCWMWPLEETKHKIGRTMATQTALLKAYPDAKYLLCEPYLIEMLEAYHPALYEQVLGLIEKGSIVLEGGVYVEGDSNMPSGESLIRQVTYGRRFFKERFNVDSRLVWQPDVFGFSAALPQIYKSCGIRYFATQKLYNIYEGGELFPHNVFEWEGLDGSRILSHHYRRSNAPMTVTEVVNRWEKDRVQQENLDAFLFPYGYGDGGGGPTRDQMETAKRIGDLEGAPRTHYAHPLDFFTHVQGQPPHPVYRGELYYPAHRGTFTSQAKTKKGNRKAESALRAYECLAAIVSQSTNEQYPKAHLDELWKKLLFAQFHDILPGTSIARVHREAEAVMGDIIARATAQTERLMKLMVKPGDAITALNLLSVERTAIVKLPTGANSAIADGERLAGQVMDGDTFVRVRLKPMSALSLLPSEEVTAPKGAFATGDSLENDYLLARFDAYGRVISLYDKVNRMEMAAGPMNDFCLYKDVTSHYDAWDINSMYTQLPVDLNETATIAVKDEKGFVASLVITRKLNDSLMRQRVSLEADSRTLRFETEIDWQEHHKLLKVAFPTVIHADRMISETQFGIISRPNHQSTMYDADRFEVCQHRFSALCDGGAGVAVLNDCKYGISCLGGTMALTLLKAPLVPDDTADRGAQSFTYGLAVFDGQNDMSDIVAQGLALNHQVICAQGSFQPGQFFALSEKNIVLETIKLSDDGKGRLILRLYESIGKTTRAKLSSHFKIEAARELNMMEEALQAAAVTVHENACELAFRPFEIKTVEIMRG